MGISQAKKGLGIKQVMQNKNGSRAFNTVYTNTKDVPILVIVATAGSSANISSVTVGGVACPAIMASNNGASQILAISFVVPAGFTYQVASGAGSIGSWMELS
jgi:D-alanine-D-alanine ligase-like ATP-grasp enzyme